MLAIFPTKESTQDKESRVEPGKPVGVPRSGCIFLEVTLLIDNPEFYLHSLVKEASFFRKQIKRILPISLVAASFLECPFCSLSLFLSSRLRLVA